MDRETAVRQIKNGTFAVQIWHSLRRKNPIRLVLNRAIRAMLWHNHVRLVFRRRYKNKISGFNPERMKDRTIPRVIWICWFQGLENAPPVVKRCYESVKENLKGYTIHFLTAENMLEYADIPEGILQKWKKGIIGNANLSDYLRSAILNKWGGVWVDATVLFTDYVDFDQLSCGSGIFVFRDLTLQEIGLPISSWLIASCPGNPILLLTQELLDDYWKNKNYAIDYFMFHILFGLAVERYPEDWEKMPAFSNRVPHLLSRELTRRFDEEHYALIKKMTPIHKLSWHARDYSEESGSYYDVLIVNNEMKEE